MLGLPHDTTYVLLIGLVFLATALCLLQLYISLGVSVGMPYVVPVLISLWVSQQALYDRGRRGRHCLSLPSIDHDVSDWIPPSHADSLSNLDDDPSGAAVLQAGEQIKTLEGLIPDLRLV